MNIKMKRLIPAILSISLLATTLLSAMPVTAADEPVKDAYTLESLLLQDLGILPAEIKDPEAELTRGEFLDIAMRTYHKEIPEYDQASTFVDVIPNHKYKNAVESAYSAGIVEGMDDGIFGVDDKITSQAAVIIMMRILGYEDYYNNFGSFDEFKDLIDGVNTVKATFNYKDTTTLIANAIELPRMRVTSSSLGSADYTMDENKPLIADRLGILEGKGIVTETPFASLTGGTPAGGDTIKINGEAYYGKNSGADEYIGYKVEFYYDKESREIYHVADDDTDVIVIDNFKNCSYSGGTLTYTTNGTNKRSVGIPVNAIIIYNGALVRSGQFDASLFDVDAGVIKVIKKSYNDKMVVSITSYSDIVCGGYAEKDNGYALVNKFDAAGSILLADPENYEITNADGAELAVTDIPDEAVISAALSIDGNSGKMIVNTTDKNKLTTAYVLSTGKDYAMLKIYSEPDHTWLEDKYEYSKSFKAINTAENIVKPTSEYDVYLDVFGKVAYMYTGGDYSDFYAYILKVYPKDEAPDADLEMKVCRDDATVAKYPVRDNVVIDGVNYKNRSDADKLSALSANQLVYMNLTYDGEVAKVDTASIGIDDPTREDENTLYRMDTPQTGTTEYNGWAAYEGSSQYISGTKQFGLGIKATADTKILGIPLQGADENEFLSLTTGVFQNDRDYVVEAYARKDDALTADFLIYRYSYGYDGDIANAIQGTTAAQKFSHRPFDRAMDTTTGVCLRCDEAVNPKTGEVSKLVELANIANGQITQYYMTDDELSQHAEAGQLLRYMILGGKICYMEKMYDFSAKTFNNAPNILRWNNGAADIYSFAVANNGTAIADNNSNASATAADPMIYISRAVIAKTEAKHIAFLNYDDYANGRTDKSYWRVQDSSSTKVFKYDEESNTFEAKSLDDMISYGDSELYATEVLVIVKGRTVQAIIMY